MANYQSAYTGEQIDTAVARINTLMNGRTTVSDLLDMVYPVGSIYMSVNNVSPATFLGGTWEQINEKFLFAGSTANYPYGSTGGAANVTLTENQIPAHKHTMEGGSHAWLWGTSSNSNTVHFSSSNATNETLTSGNKVYTIQGSWNKTVNTGGGAAHNNMPPYLSVYMWKRTA